MNSLGRLLASATLAAVGVGGAADTALGQTYRPIDLGSLRGWAEANAVNNAGIAVGSTVGGRSQYRGFVWHGALSAVKPPSPLTQVQGFDVSVMGRAVFAAYSMGDVRTRAILEDRQGARTDLGEFCPQAINRAGGVVGTQATIEPATGLVVEHAVLWNGRVLRTLPPLSDGSDASAMDVSNNGVIVGSAFADGSLTPTAVLWRRGAVRDLGTLGRTPAQATCISPNGRYVAGFSATATAPLHAFRSTINRTTGAVVRRRDLGTLAGGWSIAYDTGNTGHVVGASDGHAFVFFRGRMADLNDKVRATLGWTLIGATGINARGNIVGWGEHGALGLRAFLLVKTCSPADVAAPYGVLDAADRDFFLARHGAGDLSEADLTGTSVAGAPGYGEPDGLVTNDDLLYFLALYAAGC